MRRQLEGSRAVAEAVARCRPEVVCAYPISPQTHIIEAIGAMVRTGAIERCEFVNVESEFAAMSVSIGASAAGARAYTATASQGLLYMAEAVYNAAGLGLPIVMTLANRALGAPINIWNDHSDAMSVRDSGWIQLFAEDNQEAVDLHIQAFRLAEELSLPVMVCMDGFILTHAMEEVDLPSQAQVDDFLPPYSPRQVLDPADPLSIGAMVGPEAYTEVRYLAHLRQLDALEAIPRIGTEFAAAFGRDSGGLVHPAEIRPGQESEQRRVAGERVGASQPHGSLVGKERPVREKVTSGQLQLDQGPVALAAGVAARSDRAKIPAVCITHQPQAVEQLTEQRDAGHSGHTVLGGLGDDGRHPLPRPRRERVRDLEERCGSLHLVGAPSLGVNVGLATHILPGRGALSASISAP